ncbi:MAG: type II secretion system F family protein [Peptostreptococcaceae bacterium]|nr:type II secretion system F family protein [Peptostreptococcaceae bacterium]
MSNYNYTGRNLSGETINGTITATSSENALQLIRKQNIYPIKINPESKRDLTINLSFVEKVKSKDLSFFCRQFYAMLDAGIPLVESLDLLKKQTSNKRLKSAIEFVFEEVQKGSILSRSMKKQSDVFPDILVYMVETGEISGQLDMVMGRMADHFEKETKLQSKVKNAMLYPIIVSLVALCVIFFLITYVLPSFVDMFTGFGAQLPLPTRILLGVSSIFRNYWYLLLGTIIFMIYTFKKYGKTEKGRYKIDYLKLKIPIFGDVNSKVATSRFSRTLASLLVSGINIIEAMEIVQKVIGNAVISKGINQSMDSIRKGGGIAGPLSDLNVFPMVLISMIKVGEESGSIDTMLSKTADFYDEEVDSAVEKMTTMLEPMIIVVLALVVGMIILAVITPMFDMYQYVGQ